LHRHANLGYSSTELPPVLGHFSRGEGAVLTQLHSPLNGGGGWFGSNDKLVECQFHILVPDASIVYR
jgi:hypothetical protein